MSFHFRDYIIGFLDGEGCFYINSSNNRIRFCIEVPQRYDSCKVILLMKKELNNIGGTYIYKKSDDHEKHIRYAISSKNDIQYFIDYIGNNDFIVKKEEYDIFKKAFLYYKKHSNGSGKHMNINLYNKMTEYKLELQRLKKFNENKEIQIEIIDNQNNINEWL